MSGRQPLTDPEIAHYFELVLGRAPENEAVVRHYAAMNLTPREFVRVLMESEEVAERYRRRLALAGMRDGGGARWPDGDGFPVLLFGAYGNGNLGDAAQAEAVAWLMQQWLPRTVSLAACSWERREAFAFPGAVLPSDALLRADMLPRSSPPASARGLVAIGGGGLFGTPHFPLCVAAWAEWLAGQGVPWVLLGVGGSAQSLRNPTWRPAYRVLFGQAAFVGVRDADTLAAVQAINPRAVWFPDPVLVRSLLAPEPEAADAEPRSIDALLIPRHPNGPADAAANQALLAWRDALVRSGSRVVVVAMERALDAPALAGQDVVYVDDWSTLMRLCRQARLMASLRLHGVVAGIAAGCVVHGLVQPKIGDLMQGLGIGAWFSAAGWPAGPPDLGAAAAARFHAALAPHLRPWRAATETAMREAGEAIRALTAAPKSG